MESVLLRRLQAVGGPFSFWFIRLWLLCTPVLEEGFCRFGTRGPFGGASGGESRRTWGQARFPASRFGDWRAVGALGKWRPGALSRLVGDLTRRVKSLTRREERLFQAIALFATLSDEAEGRVRPRLRRGMPGRSRVGFRRRAFPLFLCPERMRAPLGMRQAGREQVAGKRRVRRDCRLSGRGPCIRGPESCAR